MLAFLDLVYKSYGEALRMSMDFTDSSDVSYAYDVELKKPSKFLFVFGLCSVISGTALGLFGIFSISSSSNSQEYLIGLFGYLLTALFPIIVFLISNHNHQLKSSKYVEEAPYDTYAGENNLSRTKKVVLIGLVSAAISIWVFLQPIAEKFVS
jgi:hypothetical protein